MALQVSRIVSLEELRFRPANSNDRARAGLEHAFTDVPPCSFGRDDGISHYMAAASGIADFPDAHLNQPALHDDVPQVGHDTASIAGAVMPKLGRGGFALSVFMHALVAAALGYLATVSLPDDALLAGETVISLELLSDSDVEAQSAGQLEEVEDPAKPVEEPKAEEPVAPVETPSEQAKRPEGLEKPVENMQAAAITADPQVLATDQPSTFEVEQATKTILEATEIVPLPQMLPAELGTPVTLDRPEARSAQPLRHPVSKPRKIEKATADQPVDASAEVKPAKKSPEPVRKKAEPEKEDIEKRKAKVAEKTPEKKKPIDRAKKVKGNQGADESDSRRGTTNPKRKGNKNQDASEGGRKIREIGNAAATNFKGLVQRKLERAKKRVRVAGKGSVTVSFTITASGGVTGLRVRKSSGKPAVDKGALDVVRKAAPFPAIPPEAKRSSWPMSVPMTFK